MVSSSYFLLHRLHSFHHPPLYFVRFLSLRSSILPRFSYVSIPHCASLVRHIFLFIRCYALSTFPVCIFYPVNRALSSCSFRQAFHFRRVSPVYANYAYSPHLHGMLYTMFEFFSPRVIFAFDVESLTLLCLLFCWPL